MSTPLKDFNSCMNATPTKQSATIQVILVSGDLYKNATFRSKLKKHFWRIIQFINHLMTIAINKTSTSKKKKINSKLLKYSGENQWNNIWKITKITPTIILETFCKGL